MRIIGILLCAGSAARMGFDKLTTPIMGRTAIERSADALLAGGVTELVLTVNDGTRAYVETLAFPVPHKVVTGGDTRQMSVYHALLAADGDIAVIHDAARAFVTPETVRLCIESAISHGSGIAAIKAVDTAFLMDSDELTPVSREHLYLMQTPQCFRYADIRSAYALLTAPATDDCTLYVRAGFQPTFVPASAANFKLTTPADWARAERMLSQSARYGTGYDTHRLVEGRKLILGGVDIPYEKGLLGHSDADVLVHAVMDALLGAAALGDIGKHFPDTDLQYKGADSLALMRRVGILLAEHGYRIVNVDATVIAERPKLSPHMPAMRQNMADALNVPVATVSVKATTTEGMNDEGRGLCISAQAIASVAANAV